VLDSMFGCCGTYHLPDIEGVGVNRCSVRVRFHSLMINGHVVSGSVKHVTYVRITSMYSLLFQVCALCVRALAAC
jgi:hypothetical protein